MPLRLSFGAGRSPGLSTDALNQVVFTLSYRISGGRVGNGQSPGGVILLKNICLIEFITFVRD